MNLLDFEVSGCLFRMILSFFISDIKILNNNLIKIDDKKNNKVNKYIHIYLFNSVILIL